MGTLTSKGIWGEGVPPPVYTPRAGSISPGPIVTQLCHTYAQLHRGVLPLPIPEWGYQIHSQHRHYANPSYGPNEC